MRCPFCGNDDTQVKDSRPLADASIRRRRECSACDARFTTFERVQLRELTAVKNDGRREPFEREKLLRSLKLCLQKRPVDAETIEMKANEIIRHLEALGESEVSTKKIGEFAMKEISTLDPIAYVRYASVYKDFREVNDFNEFLGDLETTFKKAETRK
jgi:transcriptional repressor NrdR